MARKSVTEEKLHILIGNLRDWIPMKTVSYVLFLAGVCLSLQGCVYLAAPATTAVIGGAALAIKGAELQSQIKTADAQEDIAVPFEKTWDASIAALLDIDIEVTLKKRDAPENGGLIRGKADETDVKVVLIKLTEKISEVGVSATRPGCLWASHDKALAELIASKIREEAQKQK
jgi:hypothetical protein